MGAGDLDGDQMGWEPVMGGMKGGDAGRRRGSQASQAEKLNRLGFQQTAVFTQTLAAANPA